MSIHNDREDRASSSTLDRGAPTSQFVSISNRDSSSFDAVGGSASLRFQSRGRVLRIVSVFLLNKLLPCSRVDQLSLSSLIFYASWASKTLLASAICLF